MAKSTEFKMLAETSEDFLFAVRKFIPEVLISDKHYKRILKTAAMIPVRFSLCCIFELALNDELAETGVSFGIPYYLCNSTLITDQLTSRDPSWAALKKLIQVRENPNNCLSQNTNFFWIEFDISGQSPYSPSLFVTITDQPPPDSLRQKHSNRITAVLDSIESTLGNDLFSRDYYQHTLRAIQQLPSSCTVKQIGIMTSRDLRTVKLIIKGIEVNGGNSVENYLRLLGYTDPLDEFIDIYEKLSPFLDSFCLSIDMADGIQPRLGWECFLAQRNPQKKERWELLYDQLVQEKLCSYNKSEAILNFPGYSSIIDYQDIWPDSLSDYWTNHKKERLSFLIRRINHIKISFIPHHGFRAKAYLALNYYRKGLKWLKDKNGEYYPSIC